jgi:hypothetical protein
MRAFQNLVRFVKLLLWIAHKSHYSQAIIGLQHLRSTISQLRVVATMSSYPVAVSTEFRREDTCFVLGNGPSLATDGKENLDIFQARDVFCVNGFVESDLYEVIKPKHYVLADPDYWFSTMSLNESAVDSSIFLNIINKTTWPLTIYMPFVAESSIDGFFSGAKNIRVCYYNTASVSGDDSLVNILYDHGLGMPSPQNVLIPTLFLSLRLGYKKIVLLGADHSWHQSLVLDEENRVCVKQPHFYDETAELLPFEMAKIDNKLFTMDAAFYAFALMFEGYQKIEKYSKHLEAKIYNASSITFIDAFKRMSLAEIRRDLAFDKTI